MLATTQPRTVCILGFHRSGTSLAARILNILGVHLGDESDLLAPEENDNPRGYWEPQWMIELNDELLGHLGGSWWQSFPGAPGWEKAPAFAPLLERARRAFAEKLGDAPLIGWKDPRTNLTLPFWLQVVPDPMYVVCLRNPVDAVASLQRRPEPTLSVHAWGELWTEYTARALRETAGRPRTLLFYEDLVSDGRRSIARLADFIGAPLEASDPRLARALAEISPDLRHHATTPRDLAALPGIPVTARMLFVSLRAAHDLCEATGEAPGAQALAEAVARLAPDLWWSDRVAARHAERAAALDAKLAKAQTALDAALDAARAELAGASERERELTGRLAQTEDEVERARAQLAEVRDSRAWRAIAQLRRMRDAILRRRGTDARTAAQ
jgi:hypothetical protein